MHNMVYAIILKDGVGVVDTFVGRRHRNCAPRHKLESRLRPQEDIDGVINFGSGDKVSIF